MLDVINLAHTYGAGPTAHHALGGVNLNVAEGELVCVVGPSGCGKSTLLRSIAGLIRPTGGRILINGTPVDGVPDDLAVVFQDYSRSLFPWMSVAENVALPRELDGESSRSARRLAVAALEEVGIGELAQRFPDEMSGGQQQRVAIARSSAPGG